MTCYGFFRARQLNKCLHAYYWVIWRQSLHQRCTEEHVTYFWVQRWVQKRGEAILAGGEGKATGFKRGWAMRHRHPIVLPQARSTTLAHQRTPLTIIQWKISMLYLYIKPTPQVCMLVLEVQHSKSWIDLTDYPYLMLWLHLARRAPQDMVKIWSQPVATWWRTQPLEPGWLDSDSRTITEFVTLCVLFALSVPQCVLICKTGMTRRTSFLWGLMKMMHVKSLAQAQYISKCSTRELIINNSWSRMSLTITQQELSKNASDPFWVGQLQHWKDVASAGHSPNNGESGRRQQTAQGAGTEKLGIQGWLGLKTSLGEIRKWRWKLKMGDLPQKWDSSAFKTHTCNSFSQLFIYFFLGYTPGMFSVLVSARMYHLFVMRKNLWQSIKTLENTREGKRICDTFPC